MGIKSALRAVSAAFAIALTAPAAATRVGYIGENPASYKSPCRDVSPSLGASDELLDYIDTPKLRELYLAWCGENGFEPVAIGAAA